MLQTFALGPFVFLIISQFFRTKFLYHILWVCNAHLVFWPPILSGRGWSFSRVILNCDVEPLFLRVAREK